MANSLKKTRDLLKKYLENKHLYILKRAIIGTTDWEDTDENGIDILKYNYSLIDKKKPSNKKITNVLKIWKRDNKIYVDAQTYSLLREDERLYIKSYNAEMFYYDPLTWEKSTDAVVEQTEEVDNIDANDENSLRMIYRFIASIASGVRKPSDKKNAIEMKKYLSRFMSKNYIVIK